MNLSSSIRFDRGVFAPLPEPRPRTQAREVLLTGLCILGTIAALLLLDRFGIHVAPDGSLDAVLP